VRDPGRRRRALLRITDLRHLYGRSGARLTKGGRTVLVYVRRALAGLEAVVKAGQVDRGRRGGPNPPWCSVQPCRTCIAKPLRRLASEQSRDRSHNPRDERQRALRGTRGAPTRCSNISTGSAPCRSCSDTLIARAVSRGSSDDARIGNLRYFELGMIQAHPGPSHSVQKTSITH
jgi:hypothetical protein